MTRATNSHVRRCYLNQADQDRLIRKGERAGLLIGCLLGAVVGVVGYLLIKTLTF